MSELGIFIDESGIIDTNTIGNNNLRDFYIVSFLFHNKNTPIGAEVKQFELFLISNGFEPELPIHSMPLIRQQKPYSELNRDVRRKLFYHLFQLMRKLKLQHKTFVCDKKYHCSKQSIRKELEHYIEKMIFENFEYFSKFDDIVIYYDKGQEYLTKILHSAFSKSLTGYRFKENACQLEYRLLQCADMVCSLELIKQRKCGNEHIKAFEDFFISGSFNKTYAKAYNNLEL